jgi:hypothetical protein
MVLARHLPSTFLMSVRPKGIKLAPSAATARVCQVQPMVGKKEKKSSEFTYTKQAQNTAQK